MSPQDIENIERATLGAVSPEAVQEIDGWLLPLDSGTVSRAYSAVPTRHQAFEESVIDVIEARYRRAGLRAVFRLATDAGFDALRSALKNRGYWTEKPVLVQVAKLTDMRAVSSGVPATVDTQPDAAWAALFLGEGFDPVDGASRVRSLSRAKDSVYASVREGGKTVAAGTMAFGNGWCSVHGMRTDQSQRGRGLAGQVLAGLADTALQRGFTQAFLQVEDRNTAALALYRRAGFSLAWVYEYWWPAKI